MWLGILGLVLLIGSMIILLKGKMSPAVTFIVLPIIAAAILGYNPIEIGEFIEAGVQTTTATAVLFIFSIPFFGIMNDVGVFDPLVNKLTKIAGNSMIAVTVCTVIIATIAHLDGSSASTALIVVPAMLPIYKKMNIRPVVLTLLIAASCGVMNLVPWGGPTMRAATVMGVDANEVWRHLIPIQGLGIVLSLSLAVIMGIKEKKNVELAKAYYAKQSESNPNLETRSVEELPKWKLYSNLALILITIGLLIWGEIALFVVFMAGLAVALLLNYKTLKEQQAALKKQATGVLTVVTVLLASGALLGILEATNMLYEMGNLILAIIPQSVGGAYAWIIGLMAGPIAVIFGTDAYFFGLFPLVAEVGTNFGVPEMSSALIMLLGHNSTVLASPMTPAMFLLLGLAGVEVKDHLKFSLPWVLAMSWIFVIFGFLIGVI